MNTIKRVLLLFFFIPCFQILWAQEKPANPSAPVTPNVEQPGAVAPKDSVREVQLVRSDVLRLQKKDSTELQILVGNAILKQGNTLFKGDSIIMNKALNIIEVFGKIHINDADSVNVYSDYLIYYGNTKIANLKKKVKLTDGKATLTTEELEYDLNTKTGTYLNGGKIVTSTSTLTSKEGYYYADTKDAYFKKDVRLVDPEYSMATDTLLYNAETQISTFVSPTIINDGKSIIRTSDGYYDMNKGVANFGKRPTIEDSTQHFVADQISFDKKTGEGYAQGNFVYKDTAQGITVMAEKSFFNRDAKTFLATVKPVMIIKQDNDSLFITGDTLYSGIQIDTVYKRDTSISVKEVQVWVPAADSSTSVDNQDSDKDAPAKSNAAGSRNLMNRRPKKEIDTPEVTLSPGVTADSIKNEDIASTSVLDADNLKRAGMELVTRKDSTQEIKISGVERIDSVRFFQAYHHVKIFADSMQAVCDSMHYSGADSIFRLFNDPVVWAKESQINGDTIFLHTQNKKPRRVEVWENAFSISKSNHEYFNQLKGNVINGYFVDGEIEHIVAKGSAESLYYLQDDDSAYTGANFAQADLINLYLQKKELQKISWVNEVSGTLYPVKEVPEEVRRFKNFKWQEDRRPKTRLELFE